MDELKKAHAAEDAAELERFGYEQTLNRVLPLSSLVFYGLAYLCPVTIFSTYGLVSNMTHGMLSLTYAVATIAMVLTALSYSHMVKAYPVAGSVYSYVQRSINPHLGFLSGWAILMDYLLLPMINYLLAAIFLAPVFPGVPSWAWIVGYIVFVSIINFFGIQLTSWVNNGLIIIQAVFVFAFLLFVIKWLVTGNGAATFFDMNAFINNEELANIGGFGVIFTGASILALSFLGFDAVTTISEEAYEPEKNVGKAILITCVGAGLYFIIVGYLCQLAWPMAWNEFESIDSGAYELIGKIAGSAMAYLFTAVYCIGCLASAMASQASAARVLFGMGRDGSLPKVFAYVHPKHKTPTFSIFLIGAISLVGIKLSLAAAASLINFGALAGFALVNISVIAHYFIKKKQRSASGIFKYLVLPLGGAIVCLLIWISLDANSKILGFSWLAVGIVYLAATTNFFRKLPPDLKMEE